MTEIIIKQDGKQAMVFRGHLYVEVGHEKPGQVVITADSIRTCKFCHEETFDWVDPDWAGGPICRVCEDEHEPKDGDEK